MSIPSPNPLALLASHSGLHAPVLSKHELHDIVKKLLSLHPIYREVYQMLASGDAITQEGTPCLSVMRRKLQLSTPLLIHVMHDIRMALLTGDVKMSNRLREIIKRQLENRNYDYKTHTYKCKRKPRYSY